jgi:hypothetical protein
VCICTSWLCLFWLLSLGSGYCSWVSQFEQCFSYINAVKSHISCTIVSMIPSVVIHRRFEPRSGQTKDYKVGICCFSAKYAALDSKIKKKPGCIGIRIMLPNGAYFPQFTKPIYHIKLFWLHVHVAMSKTYGGHGQF